MTGPSKISPLLRFSIAAAFLGILICLALLVRETPYTLTAFMFLGQPLLGIAFLLFALNVFRDLRRKKLL